MKIINKIKEKDIDVILLITLIIAVPVFFLPLFVSDELWNFAFVYKMNLGYIAYNDFNIIITPLFHIIGVVFLKIFGANFLAFRIYNFVIILTLMYLTYKIFRELKINKKNTIISILLTAYIYISLYSSGANYNILAFIPILITILLMIQNKANYYIYGLLLLITILIKQNIGVYFGFGILLYILLEKKDIIKRCLQVAIINILGIGIFLFILYKQNALYSFYYYAISGISSFSGSNTHIDYQAIIIILSIIGNFVMMYFIKKADIKEKNEIIDNIKIICCIGIPLVLTAYPIFNMYHIRLGVYVLWIGIVYILNIIVVQEIINNKLFKIILITILMLILIKETNIILMIKKDYKLIQDRRSVYYGSILNEDVENKIKKVCEFITENEKKGINTIVLSQKANLYMLPLNKNNKDGMDFPFKGNLGKDDDIGLINRIKELKNTVILIVTDEKEIFWQESMLVREYIQENLDKIGVIEEYDIYYKK